MSLSLERKDASLCAALGDGLAVHDRRPKTLASEIVGPRLPATGAPATGTATPSSPGRFPRSAPGARASTPGARYPFWSRPAPDVSLPEGRQPDGAARLARERHDGDELLRARPALCARGRRARG
ncbi:MAG: hypothetical protein ACLTDR_13445 [Adlercreutzia equolifaciens]